MRRFLIILIACVMVSVPLAGFGTTGQRIALVIGNSAYKNAPLKNPANDANDMAIMLKRLGFKVTLKTDATRRTMQNSIRAFGRELRSGGVGLFYFAGHGVQVEGSNYLIPIRANIEFKADVEYEAVDAGRILSYMEDAENGINIIILDACRNNPYSRSFRSNVNGLVKMDAPSGSILAFSTAPGSVAADGSGRNGLYTSRLLKYMATPNVNIETVFKKVRIDVSRASGKKQTPWESSSLMGNFSFNSDNTKSSQPARAVNVEKRQAPQNLNAEEETWEIVKTSSSIEDYTIFLDQYPGSRFRTAASLKIQQLKRAENAKPMLASVDQSVENTQAITPGENFEKLSNGVVYDKKTGLEWYAHPEMGTGWYQSKTWVSNLAVDGGNWRMPSKSELKTLYVKSLGTRNMTPLLSGDSCWFVWYKNASNAPFDFGFGNDDWAYAPRYDFLKAFAVRNRK